MLSKLDLSNVIDDGNIQYLISIYRMQFITDMHLQVYPERLFFFNLFQDKIIHTKINIIL